MTTAAPTSPAASPLSAVLSGLRRAEAWLDARGKWAWIATMVTGFFIAPPLGLLVLGYMIWSKRMFGSCAFNRRADAGFGRGFGRGALRPSGNSAFDNYKAETLRRLNDEHEAFDAFLTRLREARDKQEFDHFMQERATPSAAAAPSAADHSNEDNASARGASQL